MVDDLRKGVIGDIPVGPLPGVRHGVARTVFPFGERFGDAVWGDQLIALGSVHRRLRRLKIDLLRILKKRQKRIEIAL